MLRRFALTRNGAREANPREKHEHGHRYHRAASHPGIQVRVRDPDRRRHVPPGVERRRRAGHLAQEARTRMDARVAPEGPQGVAGDDGADLAQRSLPVAEVPGDQLLLGPEEPEEAGQPRRRRSRNQEDVRQAGNSARGAEGALRCGRRRGVRLGLGRHHLQEEARRARHHLLLVLGGGREPSRAGAEVPRLGRAAHRQLLRRAQHGGVQRRLVRLHAEGRSLPDGAVDLLPHQREGDGPVRAHADHRRRRRLRQLSRRLHRADARREPAARRGRRADRPGRRDDQVLHGPELVPRRQGRQGRHLQLRHQARQVR